MTTITFDTLKYVEKLKAAGVPEGQAKAEAEALSEVLHQGSGELATASDIRVLTSDIRASEDRVNAKFTLLQWMIGFSLALNTAILLKLLMH